DAPEGVEVIEAEDGPATAGLLEELVGALLPVAEVRHAGDDPLARDAPDLGELVEVAVGLVALRQGEIVDRVIEEGGLADAGRADEDRGLLAVAAEEELELLAVGGAGRADGEQPLDG